MDKLEEYRLRKRRKERVENFKKKFINMIPFINQTNDNSTNTECVIEVHKEKDKKENTSPVCSELDADFESEDDETIFPKKPDDPPNPIVPIDRKYRILFWILLFMFWATCYAIAIQLKFGVVYLLFSALFGLYFNTRTGPKKRGEISAYSVFNKDFHAIDGTLKAEQFEREIRYGSSSVR